MRKQAKEAGDEKKNKKKPQKMVREVNSVQLLLERELIQCFSV